MVTKQMVRPTKVLSRVSICVSMCEDLGNQTDLSWAENRDSSEHDWDQASSRLRYQSFDNCLEDEPRVRTPISQSLMFTIQIPTIFRGLNVTSYQISANILDSFVHSIHFVHRLLGLIHGPCRQTLVGQKENCAKTYEAKSYKYHQYEVLFPGPERIFSRAKNIPDDSSGCGRHLDKFARRFEQKIRRSK